MIGNLLAARGLDRPPADLVEPVNIRIWEAGRHTTFTERARMQAVFNTTSRGFGAFFEEWDIILTPITALPTPKVGTTRIPDDIGQSIGAGLVRQPLAQLRLHAACQSVRNPGDLAAAGANKRTDLPLGIQAMARQANDGLLLQLAAQIERALGGQWNAGRKPRGTCDQWLSGGRTLLLTSQYGVERRHVQSTDIHAAAV